MDGIHLLPIMHIWLHLSLVGLLLWSTDIWTCSCITVEIVNVVRGFVYVDVLYYWLTLLRSLLLMIDSWCNYPRGWLSLSFSRHTWTYPADIKNVQFMFLLKIGCVSYRPLFKIIDIILVSLLLDVLWLPQFMGLLFKWHSNLYIVAISLILEIVLRHIFKCVLTTNWLSIFVLVTGVKALSLIWRASSLEMDRVLGHILLPLEFASLSHFFLVILVGLKWAASIT